MQTHVTGAVKDARPAPHWSALPITERRGVRRVLIYKHGDLTRAAEHLGVTYARLIATTAGREQAFAVITAIQRDLNLTDDQVLEFWPLLKSWPKERTN